MISVQNLLGAAQDIRLETFHINLDEADRPWKREVVEAFHWYARTTVCANRNGRVPPTTAGLCVDRVHEHGSSGLPKRHSLNCDHVRKTVELEIALEPAMVVWVGLKRPDR